MRSRAQYSLATLAACSVASVSSAQVGTVDVDRVTNWSAPLYWQPSPAKPRQPGPAVRRREDAAIKAAATPLAVAVFVAMTPCRVVDTRVGGPPFGSPSFSAGEIRTIPMATSAACPVPVDSVVAYSLNIAVVPIGTTMRWLTAWDTGNRQPLASTLNDPSGLILSNAAVVPAGTGGSVNIFVTDPTHVVVDMNGYYMAATTTGPPGPPGPQGPPGPPGPQAPQDPQDRLRPTLCTPSEARPVKPAVTKKIACRGPVTAY